MENTQTKQLLRHGTAAFLAALFLTGCAAPLKSRLPARISECVHETPSLADDDRESATVSRPLDAVITPPARPSPKLPSDGVRLAEFVTATSADKAVDSIKELAEEKTDRALREFADRIHDKPKPKRLPVVEPAQSDKKRFSLKSPADDEPSREDDARIRDATVAETISPTSDAFSVVLEAAQDDSGLTLDAIEQMAFENNPTLEQANAGVCKALGIQTQVGLKPNPTIGYFAEEIGNDNSAGLHGVFVSKTIVRGDKLELNRAVIGHDVEWARMQYAAQTYKVRNDIRIQFYETLAAQKRLALAREFLAVARKGVTISKELVKAKEAARTDILQSEIQLSEITLAIQQAEIEWRASWNELMSIAGIPNLPATKLSGDFHGEKSTRDFESTLEDIISQSPLVAAACAQVRRAEANVHRQYAQTVPNVTAQLGVGHDTGTENEFVNVQFSMPIPYHNANEGNICAAQAALREATQNEHRVRLQIRRSLARVLRAYESAQATVIQYKSLILPKAEESLRLLLMAQEAGEFDFLRVFTARRTYFEVNQKYLAALNQQAQADTRIEGLLLSGGLMSVNLYDATDELRGQALNGQ